jgi:hypothetical protein
MDSCFTLTIYNKCRFACLLIFQRETTFVSVLFNEVPSIFLFHERSLEMRPVSVETASLIFTTNFSMNAWADTVGVAW